MPAMKHATPLKIGPALEAITREDWRTQAACRDHDPDLWFADRGPDLAEAQDICAGCPVTAECINGAKDRGERHGVWGGSLFVAGHPIRVAS